MWVQGMSMYFFHHLNDYIPHKTETMMSMCWSLESFRYWVQNGKPVPSKSFLKAQKTEKLQYKIKYTLKIV